MPGMSFSQGKTLYVRLRASSHPTGDIFWGNWSVVRIWSVDIYGENLLLPVINVIWRHVYPYAFN